MSKEFAKSVADSDLEQRQQDDAAELARRYGVSTDLAKRIIEMARDIDQAHAIAELMR